VLLDQPELFRTQIQALLRAASRYGSELRILLPMITTVEEVVRARQLIEDVLQKEGILLVHPLRIGAMIEVPAAVLIAPALAGAADFFSIGTNDLIQYTLACDRGNPQVAALYRFHHPAVLRLIQLTVVAAHAQAREVTVCGEAASDPRCIPLLIGLGVDQLSAGPSCCAAVRRQVQDLCYEQLQNVATAACTLSSADDVVALLEHQIKPGGETG
jgi:phosphoenolpyruvate-protein kinase (PTS system EI component)